MDKKIKSPTIIITLDYELPGNGSGDVQELIIEPTDRLLNILKARDIKMTIFFEIEEFLVFKKDVNELRKHFGYDPALLIEEQLKKIVYAGHEIGLHIHPQWIGASFKDNRFNLFSENQCLFDVYKSEGEMDLYLNDRANALKELVRKYDPSYEVTCFRAGALAIRPEKLVLKALKSSGIEADSSVVKGLYRKGKGINIDYRDARYESGFWRVNNDVCKEEQKGKIMEFPIYSRMKPEYKKLSINRIKMRFFSPSSGNPVKAMSNGYSKMAIPKTPWGMINYLLKKSPIKYDYCHMTSQEMLSFLYEVEKENGDRGKYPLTMIGHSKEFFNDKHFIAFLDSVIENKLTDFVTIRDAVKALG